MAVVSTVESLGISWLTKIIEHMRDMLENARKLTLHNYRAILQDIHEKPSIIAQTHKSSPAGDGRPVVSLRPLYLCLQCPIILTEADRDQHVESKLHCFCRCHYGTLKGHEANMNCSRGVAGWARLLRKLSRFHLRP